MQTQPTSWALTRVLSESRLKQEKGLDQLIDGTEGDRFVSISVPGYICTSPGELPVKLLGKIPEGLDLSDGITLTSLIHNDVNAENRLRLAQARPDQKLEVPDGKASIGLCQSRLEHYQKLSQGDHKTLFAEKFSEYRQLAQLHEESWKTRLLAVSVAGGLAVMGSGMLLGFPGAPVAIAGLAATFGTGWLLGKPLADRWLDNKCAQELRAGLTAPLDYWQQQVEIRTEIDRRLVLHKVDPNHEIPVPPTPVSRVEVKEDAVVVGGVRVKRKD